MATLIDIETKAASFYEQPPAERQATLQLVREAATRDPAAFEALVRQQVFDGMNNLPVYYEALAQEPAQWADFFLAEARRLLRLAKAAPNPKFILTHFGEFVFIEPGKFTHRKELLGLLTPELQNPNPIFRFQLMNTLEAMITASDIAVIQQLHTLANDMDWRIRYNYYLLAKDSPLLGGPVNLGWLDYVRAKLLSPFSLA